MGEAQQLDLITDAEIKSLRAQGMTVFMTASTGFRVPNDPTLSSDQLALKEVRKVILPQSQGFGLPEGMVYTSPNRVKITHINQSMDLDGINRIYFVGDLYRVATPIN